MAEHHSRFSRWYTRTDPRTVALLGVVFLFVVAESLILFEFGVYGLIVHALGTGVTLLAVQVTDGSHRWFAQSLLLVPVLRLFNVGLPQFTDNSLVFLGVVYTFVFVSTVTVMRSQELTFGHLGITRNNLLSVIPGSIFGIGLGGIQYTLSLEPLQYEPTLINFALVVLVTGLAVGLVEELIFRGLIQRRLSDIIDQRVSILVVSVLFGFMHSVWLTPMDIVFAGAVSVLIGYLYSRDGDLILATCIHAGINVASFLLMPAYYGEINVSTVTSIVSAIS